MPNHTRFAARKLATAVLTLAIGTGLYLVHVSMQPTLLKRTTPLEPLVELEQRGTAMLAEGDVDGAIHTFGKALIYAKKTDHQESIARVIRHLADAYAKQGDMVLATAELQKAVAISTTLGDRSGLLEGYRRMSWIYLQQEDFDAAERSLRLVLGIAEQIGEPTAIAEACVDLAEVLELLGQMEEAETLYRRASELQGPAAEAAGRLLRLRLHRPVRGV
ncbi:MAG: tetratricopeptide repeat protein [Nitrospirota bacterium]|nr:tetratricopeptide repeat protein [Nitrospirota bacterium]